jgi:hypothetical protein
MDPLVKVWIQYWLRVVAPMLPKIRCQLIDVQAKPFRNSIPFLFLVVSLNV